MAIIKKTRNKSVGKDVEKREPLCTVGGDANGGAATMENSMEVPQKLKNRTTIPSSNFTLEYLSKENKNTNSKRYMHPYVHGSIIYNRQAVEITQVPID